MGQAPGTAAGTDAADDDSSLVRGGRKPDQHPIARSELQRNRLRGVQHVSQRISLMSSWSKTTRTVPVRTQGKHPASGELFRFRFTFNDSTKVIHKNRLLSQPYRQQTTLEECRRWQFGARRLQLAESRLNNSKV